MTFLLQNGAVLRRWYIDTKKKKCAALAKIDLFFLSPICEEALFLCLCQSKMSSKSLEMTSTKKPAIYIHVICIPHFLLQKFLLFYLLNK